MRFNVNNIEGSRVLVFDRFRGRMALTLELSAGTAASSQKNETAQQPNIRNPCWHISYIVSGI